MADELRLDIGRALALVGAGAGLAYFLDPERGARRRGMLQDKVTHAAISAGRAVGTTTRDARHRLTGVGATMRGMATHEPVENDVLVDRVRAKLGRYVSHPHAIDVLASDGQVVLRGPILKREATRLIDAIERVTGVRELIDELIRYERSDGVPALQGGRAPGGERLDLFQHHWSPTTRCMVASAGAALAAAGVLRRELPGTVATVIGAGLMARAATNLPMSQVLGVGSGRRAVDIQKTITINAPVSEVYAFWSMFENFPRFMSRVFAVRPSATQPQLSHWSVAGPLGTTVEFDAETTQAIPNKLIAWKTLPGATVGHAGIVRFDPEPNRGTRVHIRMSYNPPAGWLGHELAAAFGADAKATLDEDLVRMKTLIETGHVPHDAAWRLTSHL